MAKARLIGMFAGPVLGGDSAGVSEENRNFYTQDKVGKNPVILFRRKDRKSVAEKMKRVTFSKQDTTENYEFVLENSDKIRYALNDKARKQYLESIRLIRLYQSHQKFGLVNLCIPNEEIKGQGELFKLKPGFTY